MLQKFPGGQTLGAVEFSAQYSEGKEAGKRRSPHARPAVRRSAAPLKMATVPAGQ